MLSAFRKESISFLRQLKKIKTWFKVAMIDGETETISSGSFEHGLYSVEISPSQFSVRSRAVSNSSYYESQASKRSTNESGQRKGVLVVRRKSLVKAVRTVDFDVLLPINLPFAGFNLDFVHVETKPVEDGLLSYQAIKKIFGKDFKAEGTRARLAKVLSKIPLRSDCTSLWGKGYMEMSAARLKEEEVHLLVNHIKSPFFCLKKGTKLFTIKENHPKLIIGKYFDKSRDGFAFIQPEDNRIPLIEVKKQCQFHNQKCDFIVEINESSEPGNTFLSGKIVDRIETQGIDFENMVKRSLIRNELHTKEYTADFDNEMCQKYILKEQGLQDPQRMDLREATIFTIDPPDAIHLDDAVSCCEVKPDLYQVGVHIADVSHFVRPDTELNDFARKRNLTVYLPDRSIPMLPRQFSHEFCSLQPNQDRLAISMFFMVSKSGDILSEDARLSVVRSKRKYSFEEADQILKDAKDQEKSKKLTETDKSLVLLSRVTQSLRQSRIKDGNSPVYKSGSYFTTTRDRKSGQVKVIEKPRKSSLASEEVIEELMVAANAFAGRKIYYNYPKTALLRCQKNISDAGVIALLELIRGFDDSIDLASARSLTTAAAMVIEAAQSSHVEGAMNYFLRKLKGPAKYICSGKPHKGKFYHSGMNTALYTTFTSPIRRYSDILVHRLLKESLLERKRVKSSEAIEEMTMMATLCNARKLAAHNVKRDIQKFLLREFLFKNGPLTLEAVMISMKSNSCTLFVDRFQIFVNVFNKALMAQGGQILTENRTKAILTYKDKYWTLKPLQVLWVKLEAKLCSNKAKYVLNATIDLNKQFTQGKNIELQ